MNKVRSLAIAALVLCACTSGGSLPTGKQTRAPSGSPRAARTATTAEKVKVENIVQSPFRRFAQLAIRDLKRVGLWDELTGHLYMIKLASRREALERDPGHILADAYFSGVIDEEGQGAYCDIVFYYPAIVADLERWQGYFEQGLIEQEPPLSLRHYWGALLAHELGHCRQEARGEAVAERWEARALKALGAKLE